MKKKITFITSSLGNTGRGRNITNLSNALIDLGMSVDIVLNKLDGSNINQLHPEISVIKLSTASTLLGIPALAAYINNHKPDVLVCASIRNTLLALRARIFSKYKPKIFARIHNNYSQKYSQLKPIFRRRYLKRLRKYYPLCDGIVAVSEGVAKDLADLAGIERKQIKSCPNPVITPEFHQLANEPFDHPWLNDKHVPVILAVGRLTQQKDFPTLLRAFAEVRKSMECKLIILGKGRLHDELKQLVNSLNISADVSMPGHIPNPYPWMKAASVFVLSSAWEGLPNSLIEAMATGTPVVSTNCPSGADEILENGKHGILVPVGDAHGMASAIITTLQHPKSRTELIEASTRYMAKNSAEMYRKVFGLSN